MSNKYKFHDKHKLYKYSEKIIGGLQIIWGVFLFYTTIYNLQNLYEHVVIYLHRHGGEVSIFKVAKKFHFDLLLAALTIISGLLLLLNKKSGWLLTIVTSFVTAFTIALTITTYYTKHSFQDNKLEIIINTVLLVTAFFFVSLFLLLKPFRTKYNSTSKTWWLLAIISGLLIVDQVIVQLS